MLIPLSILTLLPPLAVVAFLQTQTDLPGWVQDIQTSGVIGMFLLLAFGLLTKRLVMGWTYDAMVAERDYYRNIAYKTTDIADRQVSAAEEMLRRMDTLVLRSEVLGTREGKNDPQTR